MCIQGRYSGLFLDLGGTLLRVEDDEIYLSGKGEIELLPNVVETLSDVKEDKIFVVTNQLGISKGMFTIDDVASWINTVFERIGKPVADFWACPFEKSIYRKPSPSMVLALADKHYIDLQSSVYVGDSESDEKCALDAGVGEFVWADEYFQWNKTMRTSKHGK